MLMDSKIAFSWTGLPAYGARLIAAAGGEFPVISTRPSVPIRGMDDLLPGRILWIDDGKSLRWKDLGMDVPRVFFQASWGSPQMNLLGDEVYNCGGKVVVWFDNNWRGDFRQFCGAVKFRTLWRKRFAAAWVAGKSGRRLARYWGFSEERIFTGMFGAEPGIFMRCANLPLHQRPRRFVYVGRLIELKGIEELINAWRQFLEVRCDWELHIYGDGPLRHLTEGCRSVVNHGYCQPEQIGYGLAEARYLVNPCRNEHWGLAVCEAAQAGCGLILGDAVGCSEDLCNDKNGVVFKTMSVEGLATAFYKVSTWDDERQNIARNESMRLGSQFTPSEWATQFHRIIKAIK